MSNSIKHFALVGISIGTIVLSTSGAKAAASDSVGIYEERVFASAFIDLKDQDIAANTGYENSGYLFFTGSAITKVGNSIELLGIINSAVGIYELASPDNGSKQDGKKLLIAGFSGVAVGVAITELGKLYEKNHPEKYDQYSGHHHHRQYDRIYRNGRGYYRVSMIGSDKEATTEYVS